MLFTAPLSFIHFESEWLNIVTEFKYLMRLISLTPLPTGSGCSEIPYLVLPLAESLLAALYLLHVFLHLVQVAWQLTPDHQLMITWL